MVCFCIVFVITLFITFALPHIYKIDSVEDYNHRLIPIATVFGVVAVICMLIAIWPVWGYTSLLVFFLLWKGFFEVSTLLPGGDLGSILFILINVLAIFSYKFIEHEGYMH